MSVVPMKRVALYVHQAQVDAALDVVQSLGSVEFIQEESDGTVHDTYTHTTNLYPRVSQAVQFLEQYTIQPSLWRRLMDGTTTVLRSRDIANHQNNLDHVLSVITDVEALETQELTEREELRRLRGQYESLLPWQKLPFALADFYTKHTATVLVALPTTALRHQQIADVTTLLNRELQQYEFPYHIESVSPEYAAVVMYGTSDMVAATIETVIKPYGGSLVPQPVGDGTPEAELQAVTEQIERMKVAYNTTQAQIASFAADHLGDLRIKHDILAWAVERQSVASVAQGTNYVAVFSGWIKVPAIHQTQDALAQAQIAAALEVRDPEPEEVPPVEIENTRIARPFEFITRLYGLPGHRDLDPTLFLAGFFFLFFGLSLTDVGYGLFLMTAALLMLFVFKLSKTVRQFGSLLFLMGLGSTLVGLLFGGYFGIDPTTLPGPLQAIQQFDPIADPLPVFYLALGLGVIQVMFGMGLKILSDARNGRLLDGLLDQVPWLTLFVTLLLYGAAAWELAWSAYTQEFLYLVYGSVVAIILTSARAGTSILQKIQYSLLSLYQSIGYFSDILSYSRLLALGLATTALAFAVNLIAEIVYEAVPYVGIVLAIMVLIIGHAFTLAVNTLGAFIHSARLQFVEFFGKFITGSGRVFQPLTRSETYVAVQDDSAAR